MEAKFIKELAIIMKEADLDVLDYASGEERIKLKKNINVKKHEKKFKSQNNIVSEKTKFEREKLKEEYLEIKSDEDVVEDSNLELDLSFIKSTMIGMFYGKPAPDEDNFVEVGSKVKKGDVICIIESMKLMNEVKAPYDCEIISILATEQEMVEFGQELFGVKEI